MDAKTYLKISAINLGFLAAGVGIGIYIDSGRVHAQEQFESVSPVVTVGLMGIGTLLAGRIAGDQISSHGIDLLKFDENVLNYLSSHGVGTAAGWQGVVADSRVPKPLQMAAPQAPPANKPEVKPEPKTEEKAK